jgi:hypothetical protein
VTVPARTRGFELNSHPEPPHEIGYTLEEALDLLAALEEARDALAETNHLVEVSELEHQVQILSRRLGFGDTGDRDG